MIYIYTKLITFFPLILQKSLVKSFSFQKNEDFKNWIVLARIEKPLVTAIINLAQTIKNGDGANQFHVLVLRDFHPANHRDFAKSCQIFFVHIRLVMPVAMFSTEETTEKAR